MYIYIYIYIYMYIYIQVSSSFIYIPLIHNHQSWGYPGYSSGTHLDKKLQY